MSYICIEGCIGAGKTTVATLLSEKLQTKLLLEDFEKHPFLDDFYSNPNKYVFETELTFLLMHYSQVKKNIECDSSEIISDFYIGKDIIFADANLTSISEISIFKNVYDHLVQEILKPNLIIYLKASDALLMERIHKRGRENEQGIGIDYIARLNNWYKNYFKTFNDIPVIEIDMNRYDFVANPHQINDLLDRIDATM